MSTHTHTNTNSGGADEFFPAEGTRASVEVERVTPGIELEREASMRAAVGGDTAILPRLLDASGVLQDAASAIIDGRGRRDGDAPPVHARL